MHKSLYISESVKSDQINMYTFYEYQKFFLTLIFWRCMTKYANEFEFTSIFLIKYMIQSNIFDHKFGFKHYADTL